MKFFEIEEFDSWQSLEELPGVQIQRLRNFLIGLFIFTTFLFLAEVFYLSIVQHKHWSFLAERNRKRIIIFPAFRGLIFDRNGKVLAKNEPTFDLLIDVNQLIKNNQTEETLNFLKNLGLEIKIPAYQRELIIPDIDKETAFEIKVNESKFPALKIIRNFKRIYPYGESASSYLGYVSFVSKNELEEYSPLEKIGRAGIEKFYQSYLRGKPGRLVYELDTRGRYLDLIEKSDSNVGLNLYLTVDQEFQKQVYQLMKNYMISRGFKRGALVMMDVHDGSIISLISYPAYDPENLISALKNKDFPFFNRVISGRYSPGSTVKPILAVGALEEKIITPEQKIYSPGYLKIENPYFPNKPYIFKDWKVHGWTDLRSAIANSVNVYFYTIGGGYKNIKGLGIKKIRKYYQLFGMGKKTSIDIPGEFQGFVPGPETKAKNLLDPIWRIGDTYNVSIGQGDLLVTPLQIALWTAGLATNKLVQPHLIDKIVNEKGEIVYQFQPKIIRENLVSPENLKIVQEGMRLTVLKGTAKMLGDLPIAGKSGTPQALGNEKLNAIFTGWFPYKNPQVVLTILIEDIKWGSVAVLPLYRQIVELWIEKYQK